MPKLKPDHRTVLKPLQFLEHGEDRGWRRQPGTRTYNADGRFNGIVGTFSVSTDQPS